MLSIKIESPSLARFQARFRRFPADFRAARDRGLQRAAEIAKEEIGALAPASFRPYFYARFQGGGDTATAVVGMDTRAKPYAAFVNRGTGVYAGHSPWTVEPVRAKALRFAVGGAVLFRRRVTIRGMRGRRFMERGRAAARPRIGRSLVASLGNVTRRLVEG